MKFLREVLTSVKRIDDEDVGDDVSSSDLDDLLAQYDGDVGSDTDDEPMDQVDGDDEFTPPDDGDESLDDAAPGEGDDEFTPPDDGDDSDVDDLAGDIANDVSEDPNRQGLIRVVKGAHLVYKRETEDGSFEELWMYNIVSLRDELKLKKMILAGTDIPPTKTQSDDGSQTYEIWSAGNAELILIRGLPN